jgi:hypothetical protein
MTLSSTPIDGYASILTTSLGQVSGQPFVLLLHRKIALAYARQDFDNRLTVRYRQSSVCKFFLEGKPKCQHFNSPSGATEGVIVEKHIKYDCVLTWKLDSGGPPEEVSRMTSFSVLALFGALVALGFSLRFVSSASFSND